MDSSVSTAIRLRSKNLCQILGRGKRFLSSVHLADRLREPPNEKWYHFPGHKSAGD
jgi:hypothetical protein